MRNLRDINQFVKLYLRSVLDFSFESKVLLTLLTSHGKMSSISSVGSKENNELWSALVLLSKYWDFFSSIYIKLGINLGIYDTPTAC